MKLLNDLNLFPRTFRVCAADVHSYVQHKAGDVGTFVSAAWAATRCLTDFAGFNLNLKVSKCYRKLLLFNFFTKLCYCIQHSEFYLLVL
jgi:hypothetical protein